MARELGAAVNARRKRTLSLREIAAKLADGGKLTPRGQSMLAP
jgi:hypothetical protein